MTAGLLTLLAAYGLILPKSNQKAVLANHSLVLIKLTFLTCLFFTFTYAVFAQDTADAKLELHLSSKKDTYFLGEPLEFKFELRNPGKEPVKLTGLFATGEGFLNVEVSRDGKTFEGCSDPGWGMLDLSNSPVSYITRKKPAVTEASILWTHETQDTRRFRFREPGIYYFRASFSPNFVSAPIKIEIVEPKGDDLEVWKRIAYDGDIAYFILRKEVPIPHYKSDERARFINRIENLVADHPATLYAALLRPGLEKLRGTADRPLIPLEVKLKFSEKSYRLGEIAQAKATVRNTSTETYLLEYEPVLMIARGAPTNFGSYQPPLGDNEGFTIDGINIVASLKPGESWCKERSVFWNYLPSTKHLNKDAARFDTDGRLLTDYAFPEAGTYYIKARLGVRYDKTRYSFIESEPVKIEAKEPRGDDLKVWNALKANPELGHFYQSGKMERGYRPQQRINVILSAAERLIADHPNSHYADILRASLAKYKSKNQPADNLIQRLQKTPEISPAPKPPKSCSSSSNM